MSDLYRRCEVGTRLRSRPHPDAFWSDKYGWLEEVTEPLLTRGEAAADPEVIEAVMRGAIYWPATKGTDDE